MSIRAQLHLPTDCPEHILESLRAVAEQLAPGEVHLFHDASPRAYSLTLHEGLSEIERQAAAQTAAQRLIEQADPDVRQALLAELAKEPQ